ncbi:MAG TPA: UDP-N-acetylmuramate--L-alanine ligase [Anaerohalosphaeraceae bacterium]|nr:UDP-N-acetylmuramate--L-alanine ligase [Anaerohalosphaeraceae bacterium]
MESFQGKKFHFIGIGGIGTSGLAKMLLKHGAVVSGSDMADSAVLQEMASMGIRICLGHSPENIPPDADAVVISAAIPAGNPELARAGELGIRIYKYAEMLGKLFGEYQGIAVAGTHGKSTTSAWIAYLLEKAGRSPTFLIGAHVPQMGGSSGIGDGPFFVAEACEYDRSFLNLRPLIGVILNIEQDHLDYYRDEEEIVDAFTDFAGGIRPGGVLIANGQDRNTLRLLRRLNGQVQVRTFGRSDSCDLSAGRLYLREGFYEFELCERGAVLGLARLSIPGIHNVDNALAVVSACLAAGLSVETILEHLGGFTGIDRRLMLKGQLGGVVVLDDYAHHPTEIRASLLAIRERYHPKHLWCVFQPHQYSRTRFLLDDFAESFNLADTTIVPEIYFVRDTAESRKMVNAEVLVERIRRSGSEAVFIRDFPGIVSYLKEHVQPGDLVVTMGAGTIWKVADEYLQWLRAHC